MPWDGNGNFSRTDGTRTGAQTWTEADAAAVGIEADDHDVHDQDLADGIEACLAKNGENSASLLVMAGVLKMEGNQLRFDADEDTHFAAGSDDILIGTVGGSEVARFITTGLQVKSADAGADVGPVLTLYRDSATPAVADLLGGLNFDGEDSAGNQDTYAAIRAAILDPTSASEDGELNIYLNVAGTLTELFEFRHSGGVPQFRIQWNDDGSGEGPYLTGRRQSASPAANDSLFAIQGVGKNDAAEDVTYSKLSFDIADPADGSEDGIVAVHVQDGGSLTEYARFTNSQLLIGKTTAGIGETGVQMGTGGILMATSANAPMRCNRESADGQLIIFYRDAVEVGDITVTTGTVSLTGFTGAHASSWADEVEVDPPVGSLVSVAEVEHKPLHPCVRMTRFSEDRRVYGVFAGRKESGALQIHASGIAAVRVVGPVYAGDLLISSQIPGVAMRQGDDVVRSSTVGKVTLGDALEGERLVPCVLCCGG